MSRKVITLSCDGMLTPTYGANRPAMPQSAQKSTVIVNFDDQTIFFLGYVTPIEGVDGASILSAEGRLSTTVSTWPSVATLIGQLVGRMQR